MPLHQTRQHRHRYSAGRSVHHHHSVALPRAAQNRGEEATLFGHLFPSLQFTPEGIPKCGGGYGRKTMCSHREVRHSIPISVI